MITVLIADDQTLFRSMLEKQLALDPDISVVASVGNGEEAFHYAMKLRPDVILLDSQMPIKDGITALKEIRKELPSAKIAILTAFESPFSVIHASNDGADGYLVKDMTPEVLAMAIKCIYHDLVVFHKSTQAFLSSGKSTNDRIHCAGFTFDHIDVTIIKHIAEGLSNKEIARQLDYSEGTIKNRISSILATTSLTDRTQLSIFAIKNNMV